MTKPDGIIHRKDAGYLALECHGVPDTEDIWCIMLLDSPCKKSVDFRVFFVRLHLHHPVVTHSKKIWVKINVKIDIIFSIRIAQLQMPQQ